VGTEIAAVAIHGVWWRHVPHGRDPLARPEPPRNARWPRGHIVDALYLTDSRETAWAEWYRWLAEYGLPPARGLLRDLWRVEVELQGVMELRSTDALGRVGLEPPRPSSDDWPAFQEVGERLAAEVHPGLVGPSATRSGDGAVHLLAPTGLVAGRGRRAGDGERAAGPTAWPPRLSEPGAHTHGRQTAPNRGRR
jgi:RES domain-containing protein